MNTENTLEQELSPPQRSGWGAIVAVVLGVFSVITLGNTVPMMFISFYFSDVGVSEAWRNVLFVVGCSVLPVIGIVLGCYNTNSRRPRLAIAAISICSFALCFSIALSLLWQWSKITYPIFRLYSV